MEMSVHARMISVSKTIVERQSVQSHCTKGCDEPKWTQKSYISEVESRKLLGLGDWRFFCFVFNLKSPSSGYTIFRMRGGCDNRYTIVPKD